MSLIIILVILLSSFLQNGTGYFDLYDVHSFCQLEILRQTLCIFVAVFVYTISLVYSGLYSGKGKLF